MQSFSIIALFTIRVSVGTILFTVVLAPAFGLDWLLTHMAATHLFTRVPLTVALTTEWVLVGSDVLLFFSFIVSETVKTHRDLWK
jgi:hypothetical protein